MSDRSELSMGDLDGSLSGEASAELHRSASAETTASFSEGGQRNGDGGAASEAKRALEMLRPFDDVISDMKAETQDVFDRALKEALRIQVQYMFKLLTRADLKKNVRTEMFC